MHTIYISLLRIILIIYPSPVVSAKKVIGDGSAGRVIQLMMMKSSKEGDGNESDEGSIL